MKNVLVIAAHPDDEVLGCGATIAKHAKSGDSVHIVILSEGVTSRDDRRDRLRRDGELSDLAKAAFSAKDILGAKTLDLHEFPDNRMDSIDHLDIVKVVEKCLNMYEPGIVYTHHSGDVNIDHRRIHEAVITATRPQPGQTVNTLLFFEVQSSTEWQPPGSAPAFAPNWFVNVSSTLELKIEALAAYKAEMRKWPHARSCEAVEHLARWRGANIGCEAAEAFILGRKIVSGDE
ncbi:MAG: PIG-L family deacetylase [Chitinophagaceae bacterium]|nr:PIG-L family deacetylase [Chitinophagaceae bacterium]